MSLVAPSAAQGVHQPEILPPGVLDHHMGLASGLVILEHAAQQIPGTACVPDLSDLGAMKHRPVPMEGAGLDLGDATGQEDGRPQ